MALLIVDPDKHIGNVNAWRDTFEELGSGPINWTKNSDDDFEPRTDLSQPVGCLPVLTAN